MSNHYAVHLKPIQTNAESKKEKKKKKSLAISEMGTDCNQNSYCLYSGLKIHKCPRKSAHQINYMANSEQKKKKNQERTKCLTQKVKKEN